MTRFAYRPDIDGLRTLAVMPVILFHAGATWLPGGFVGVDIFFVISGYLISKIILREVQAGEFSFLRFYERRLRRIVPALLVMLLITVMLFQVIALPDQAQGAAESGIAALLSVSNIYFWLESGYFAPTAEFMPLLHTWSLAVEEQFYLIFPVILMAIWKLRLPLRPVILAGTVLAFAIGVWLSVNKSSVAYYLLPARVWELAAGAVIASGAVPQIRNTVLREVIPALGIALILFAIFWIRSDMIFPGWVALIPCLGAAMIIHAGGQSWVARRILAAPPMVFVGLLSYSLYLWHWPVLAALRVRSASIHLDPVVAIAAIMLTFLLAWLSWRYVERPFRTPQGMTTRRMVTLLGTGSAMILAISATSVWMSGFPGRLSDQARDMLAAAADIDPLTASCETMGEGRDCRFGNPDAPVTYAIIGDSHAAALRAAVEASGLMGDEAGTLYWFGNCPLLEGAELRNYFDRAGCTAFKSTVWDEIAGKDGLRTVILAGRWPFQMTGLLPEDGGSFRTWLVDAETIAVSGAENAAVMERSLLRTIDRLTAAGLEVVIIGSVPEPGFNVPHTVAMALHAGVESPGGIRRELIEARAGEADNLLDRLARSKNGVRFVPLWAAFCNDTWCDIARNGVPIFYDSDHLSYTGSVSIVAPALAEGG